jgi:hypothetical protein
MQLAPVEVFRAEEKPDARLAGEPDARPAGEPAAAINAALPRHGPGQVGLEKPPHLEKWRRFVLLPHCYRENKGSRSESGTARWAVLGSNQRPPACRAGALPTELTARAAENSNGAGTARRLESLSRARRRAIAW